MTDELTDVVVAAIGRAHGIRGDVVLDLRTDEPERRFAEGAVLTSEDGASRFTIESTRWHSGRLLAHFSELADRTTAEAARGVLLVARVPTRERPDDPEEYYDRQLVGLAAVSTDGRAIGTVTSVVHLEFQDLLEIATYAGPKLVPFVAALVPEVDLDAGVVRVAEVPGLLDDDAETAAPEDE